MEAFSDRPSAVSQNVAQQDRAFVTWRDPALREMLCLLPVQRADS